MPPAAHTEEPFEIAIADHLLGKGWSALSPEAFDRERAIFPETVLAFIEETQPKAWSKLQALHGDNTGDTILQELCRWMDKQGCLTVLRHGFKCYGQLLKIAFFRPAHGLNPEAETLYEANRLCVTRQLRYSTANDNELDLTLSVNGIPVATAELKNPMTGTTVEHAKHQYRQDRDPREKIFAFKARALVHFAVDTEQVFMTTKPAKGSTFFLPFNRGDHGGGGNPPTDVSDDYPTAYLWKDVWQRDSWMDILGRFMHLQVEEKRTDDGKKIRKETMIFPRYHQLDAVRKMVATAREEGPGHNYLVEHSAGSGKSNTIAWLAHRLSNLHDEADERTFDCVVVITDRTVLDRQLQDTIYQFEHKQGVVQKIDKDSRQLAEALDSGVPIVITTLQKFPFVTQHLVRMAEERGKETDGTLAARKYAVLIDEAHSSQSGEGAAEMKGVLGGQALKERVAEELEDAQDMVEREVVRAAARRGKQEHISFFAFTATPKHKTYGVFGREGRPFHLYTMRQAIEEGFIMDVLKNYTTYSAYYRLLKACEDDPNVPRKAAARELAKFLRLHPHNISQKTEVMVEHFREQVRHRIGGKAKAMVVTDSRLAAVRYKQAFDKYIGEKGYTDVKSLVAFSGVVQDDEIPDKTYTEVEMNQGVKEKELPEKFATPEYQVLLVAEKYQTGFDQPLLHTMYVDKRLSGIQAVQTLSRLNRMHPLKEDTFVLDFRNDREEIFHSFKDYYEGAEIGEEPEPSRLYELQADLDESGLYLHEEMERFCRVFFQAKRKPSPGDHRKMDVALKPAADRFKQLQADDEENDDTDAAEELRSKIASFRSLYGYLSQIIPFQDSDLEKLYTFLRFLSARLPKRKSGDQFSFDDEVRLEYYRLQKIAEGSIHLGGGEAQRLKGPTEVGTGKVREDEIELSQLIGMLNERFGTDFTEADQLFFDQLAEEAVEREELQQAANANPLDKFQLLFQQVLQSLVIDRMEQNEDIAAKVLNEEDFGKVVARKIGEDIYKKLRLPKEVDYVAD
ncbi:MAG: type I restriction endonuclease [Verrucomicrobiales bacterium]